MIFSFSAARRGDDDGDGLEVAVGVEIRSLLDEDDDDDDDENKAVASLTEENDGQVDDDDDDDDDIMMLLLPSCESCEENGIQHR